VRDPGGYVKGATPGDPSLGRGDDQKGERFSYLKSIAQPVLIINGHDDIMVPTVNSFILQQNLPNGWLILYRDSGHGAQFQYPTEVATQTRMFLA
jgi:pimeloyl-ACP methyl ester carboxylesterase